MWRLVTARRAVPNTVPVMKAAAHLLIDAGNSRLKWGLLQNRQTPFIMAGCCASQASAEALAAQWQALAQQPLAAAWVANVAGEAVAANIRSALATISPCPIHWPAAEAQAFGLQNSYAAGQLGVDRWLALIGARTRKPDTPLLVVLAGTATTLDVLSAEGRFTGGMILPGVELMHQALSRNTARLPVSKGALCALPRNTEDAIASGCLYAQAGALERVFNQQLAHQAKACCLMSGGNAAKLATLVDLPVQCIDNLVLDGLCHIALSA